MQNLGEEITGEYLRNILGCEFIQYNLYTVEEQGEIDVIGLDVKNSKIYICEVVTHLVTGLMYVDTVTKKSNNVKKLTDKFGRNMRYTTRYFPEHEKHFMLWSPIVKSSKPTAKHDQMRDIRAICATIRDEFEHEIELIINEEYKNRLGELRDWAGRQTKELKSPVLRLMQIEAQLGKHIKKLQKSNPMYAQL